MATTKVAKRVGGIEGAEVDFDLETGARENGNEQALHFRILDLMAAEPNQVALCERALVTITAHHPPTFKTSPRGIWSTREQNVDGFAWFARSFRVPEALAHADLVMACDNEFTAYLKFIASSSRMDPQVIQEYWRRLPPFPCLGRRRGTRPPFGRPPRRPGPPPWPQRRMAHPARTMGIQWLAAAPG